MYVSEKERPTTAVIHASNTFGGTLWNSIELLGRGVRVTGLVLTALRRSSSSSAPSASFVWYVVRRVRRSRRQAAQPTAPA